MAGERHGRGMGTACYVWIGLIPTDFLKYVNGHLPGRIRDQGWRWTSSEKVIFKRWWLLLIFRRVKNVHYVSIKGLNLPSISTTPCTIFSASLCLPFRPQHTLQHQRPSIFVLSLLQRTVSARTEQGHLHLNVSKTLSISPLRSAHSQSHGRQRDIPEPPHFSLNVQNVQPVTLWYCFHYFVMDMSYWHASGIPSASSRSRTTREQVTPQKQR